MAEKEFKSYRQILNTLRERGMNISKGSQGSKVMRILEKENYYNIVNGYKDFFLLKRQTSSALEQYKPGTTFSELYALYNFDREVRSIHLKHLLKLENMFKTVISHEFSAKYGHDNYLKLDNFDKTTSKNISSVIKLFGDIQQEIARQMNKNHQVVTHYMTCHGYIPLWVLVNVLTFGKIEYFYRNMKAIDKVVVAKQFLLQPEELLKYMNMLGMARNKCAHGERFFDISFRKNIHTKSIKHFSSLGLPRSSGGSYKYGINDTYTIAIMFAMLLSKSDLNEFISSMKSVFTKLDKQLHTVSLKDIMLHMGYGPTWDNLPLLKAR